MEQVEETKRLVYDAAQLQSEHELANVATVAALDAETDVCANDLVVSALQGINLFYPFFSTEKEYMFIFSRKNKNEASLL